jgi:dTDP-4-dehydrorhamnose 3,5-epimerase
MGSLQIHGSDLEGVYAVDTKTIGDLRGIFARCFCELELESVLGGRRIVQANVSRTTSVGAIRGLHFQHVPHAEMKLIRCLRGRVWDIAVDLRANSPTFLKSHAEELSSSNMRMMIIPEGCAHGFQVLEPDSELLYLHTAAYDKASEGGVRYDDPRLKICWPLSVSDISERDRSHPLLSESFPGINT